jgi:copper homeostasis protein
MPLRSAIVLEVCIDRFSSAMAAIRGGANRLEVCGALGSAGVTPSIGFVEQCLELEGVSRMVMVRPHEGGFDYDSGEIQTMLRDIERFKSVGAEGVVLGVLRPDGSIDRENCRRLIDAARPMEVTFHRAFDVIPEPLRALDDLVDLGCDRLLTSGQATVAMDGAILIRDLVARAGEELSIVAGTGIHAENVQQLLQVSGVREIHISGSTPESPTVRGAVTFGSNSRITSERKVRAVRNVIASM